MRLLTPTTLARLQGEIREAFPDTRFQIDEYLKSEIPEHIARGLLKAGHLEPGDGARLMQGEPNACHDNSIRFYESRAGRELWVGFALGAADEAEDNCWRWHWWAREADGELVETTVGRLIYFGVKLAP